MANCGHCACRAYGGFAVALKANSGVKWIGKAEIAEGLLAALECGPKVLKRASPARFHR